MSKKLKELCIWLNENKKGLLQIWLTVLMVDCLVFTNSLLIAFWLVTVYPEQFAVAPMQIVIGAGAGLITAVGGAYVSYQRIKDSDNHHQEKYRVDSELNSISGQMPKERD